MIAPVALHVEVPRAGKLPRPSFSNGGVKGLLNPLLSGFPNVDSGNLGSPCVNPFRFPCEASHQGTPKRRDRGGVRRRSERLFQAHPNCVPLYGVRPDDGLEVVVRTSPAMLPRPNPVESAKATTHSSSVTVFSRLFGPWSLGYHESLLNHLRIGSM